MAMIPATTHAPSTSAGVPTAWAITAALRKMPVPMVIPTTSEVAWTSVSPRRGSRRTVLTGWVVPKRRSVPEDDMPGTIPAGIPVMTGPRDAHHELQGSFFPAGRPIFGVPADLSAGALRLPGAVVSRAPPGV